MIINPKPLPENELKLYAIAYLDLLGTSSKIKNDKTGEYFFRIHTIYNMTVSYSEDERLSKISYNKIKTKIFSDNIIMAIPLDSPNDIDAIRCLLRFVSIFQNQSAVLYSWLVRGGITIGNLFLDKVFVWGTGLLRAYELENHIAIYPRIVICWKPWERCFLRPNTSGVPSTFKEKRGGSTVQLKYHMLTIEDLVPVGHFLRKLEAVLDLSFVYEETAGLYSRKYGRPPIDPVVLVKYLLVGYLYGIPSERQIEQRIQTDVALRWYLGIDLLERVPDHSTISQLRRRKPAFRKVFRRLFERVVNQYIGEGLVSGRLVLTDSSHVKANASRASEEQIEMPESPGAYWKRLDTYEEEGLEELKRRTGKRREKRTRQIKKDSRRTKKRVSRTDPEAGHMKRPGKPQGQYYLSHQTLDSDHGIIVGLTVTPGDVHDTVPYLNQLETLHQTVIPFAAAAADSAYDFPLAHRELEKLGITFFVRPQAVYDRTQVEFKRDSFSYQSDQDAYLCPQGKTLRLNGLYRSASGLFWQYKAEKADCVCCPVRGKCLSEQDRRGARKLEDSYFKPSVQRSRNRQSTDEYRQALKKRQIWCEGTFAAQKWSHNLTRVLRRGLEAAEDHCLLSAVALNLKRMIKCLN